MVSREDIKMVCMVQNLIEQCIQLDMSREDTMSMLSQRAKIEPGFTELVWMRLEEENQDFFEAYNLRLALKQQILLFNELLKKQAELMNQVQSPESSSSPGTNGSGMKPVIQWNSEHYAAEDTGPPIKPESLHPTIAPRLPSRFNNGSAFNNGSTQLHENIPSSFDLSIPTGRICSTPNTILAQSSSMRMMHTMNGGMIKSESGYSSGPQFMFSTDGHILETSSNMRDPSVACLSGMEPTSQPLNESLLDVDSLALLGQLQRNFSLSELTTDYSDMLETYPRSPFMTTNVGNYLDSHERGDLQEDNKRLDTISEGLSYEDFGSE